MFTHNEKETRLLRNITQLLAALDVTVAQAAEPGNEAIGYNAKDRAMAQIEAILKDASRLERLCSFEVGQCAAGNLSTKDPAADSSDRPADLSGLRRQVLARAEKLELTLQ